MPIGKTYEPDDESEEPFVVTENDMWITFSPTEQLRARVRQKKTPNPGAAAGAPARGGGSPGGGADSSRRPEQAPPGDRLGASASLYEINNYGTLTLIVQHSDSGENIAQTGERAVAQTGASSIAQTGDSAAVQTGGADKPQPSAPESKFMKVARAVAFCIGVVLVVLAATGTIERKAGIAGGIVLMAGSAGLPSALKLLGVGGS